MKKDEATSKSAVEQFQREGWLKIDGLLSAETLEELNSALAIATDLSDAEGPREESDPAPGPGARTGDIWLPHLRRMIFRRYDYPIIDQVAKSAEVGGLAATLMGAPAARLWVDETFEKPSGGDPTKWHQDFPYWPFDRAGALTIWIALEDVEADRGPMRYVPGSKWFGSLGRPQMTDGDIEATLARLSRRPGGDVLSEPVTVPIKAGDALVHDSLTLHGAHANRSGKARRAIAFAYFPVDALYTGVSYPQSDNIGLVPFQGFDDERFPVVKCAT